MLPVCRTRATDLPFWTFSPFWLDVFSATCGFCSPCGGSSPTRAPERKKRAYTFLARRSGRGQPPYDSSHRHVRRPPRPLPLPSEVWINRRLPAARTQQRKKVSKLPCRVSHSALTRAGRCQGGQGNTQSRGPLPVPDMPTLTVQCRCYGSSSGLSPNRPRRLSNILIRLDRRPLRLS